MSDRNIIHENLDEKDILILRTLQQNAKLTTKQVAAECHLSLTPVFERIKRLENEGYIKRYITILDAEKLHRGFIVFCSVRMSHMNRITSAVSMAMTACSRICDKMMSFVSGSIPPVSMIINERSSQFTSA